MTEDTSSESDTSLPESLQRFSNEFDVLCQMQNDKGAAEYGQITFLKIPLIRYAAEELADFANYSRFLYIKLRLLEEYLSARGIDLSAGLTEEVWSEDQVPSGPPTFIPAEEVQGFLSKEK